MLVLQVIISLLAFTCLIAIVKPFKPFPTRGKAFLGFLGFCLLNGLTAAVGGSSARQTINPNASISATKEAAPTPLKSEPSSPEVEAWEYHTSTDEMTDRVSYFACTSSINKLDFSFPYSGGSDGRLCFRRKTGELNAYVTISSGQFLCGIEDCPLRLKFDGGSIQRFSAIESATHESNQLFIEPASRLLSIASKSKNLKLEAAFYQEGNQVLQFDVHGLDVKKLSGK